MAAWGIDISNHQKGANLVKAKAAGCGFVFAKATEGLTYVDSEYADFRAAAKAAGLPFGAYHFARPQAGRTGEQEARHFLTVAGTAHDLPPVLDLEDTRLSPAATYGFALEWLATVAKATGVRPIVYTYSAFAAQRLGAAANLAAYPLWLANYRTTPPPAPAPWKAWTVWQHTSSATVPGIPGNCDRNIAAAGFPTTVQEDEFNMMTPDERKALIDDIAQAVVSKPVPRPGNYPVALGEQVGAANVNAYRVLQLLNAQANPDAIAAAVVAKLPTGQTVDKATLTAAFVDALTQLAKEN